MRTVLPFAVALAFAALLCGCGARRVDRTIGTASEGLSFAPTIDLAPLGFLCLFVVGAAFGVVVIYSCVVFARARRRAIDLRRSPAARSRLRVTPAAACPECGSDLPADAPEGLCPQCLLKGVISSAHAAAQSAPAEATGPYAGPAMAPAVAELAPLFPQLEILELIGQGGMGAVYKARQPSLDRLVAVKVLPREAGQDPAFAERFSREARALARLGHPNIVAVHDVGKAGDFYYFVMEYVDGANLRQVLRDGQLRPEQALRIVPQICDALQYAHEEGVVHRDIKPENILLDRKGRVKIADFGLAKLLGRDTDNFTLTGSRQVMGTLYYMAPEQVERPLEVDHRADIYSLGVVFYEMLTGQLPVGRFPMPSEKAGTDAYLDEVVLHALEREPAKRYQHASEVKTDVEAPARKAATVAFSLKPAGQSRIVRFLSATTKWIVRLLSSTTTWIVRLLSSTTTWTVLCCFIGLLGCSFLPWAQVHVQGRAFTSAWNFSRDAEGLRWDLVTSGPGYVDVRRIIYVLGGETWQGLAGVVLFLLLAVFLFATSSLDPVPVWRSLITLGAGLAILVLAASFLTSFDTSYFDTWRVSIAAKYPVVKDAPAQKPGNQPPVPAVPAAPPKVMVTAAPAEIHVGPFVPLVASLVLVFIGSGRLRWGLRRRHLRGTAGGPTAE